MLLKVIVEPLSCELFGRMFELFSNFDLNKFAKLFTLICFRLLRCSSLSLLLDLFLSFDEVVVPAAAAAAAILLSFSLFEVNFCFLKTTSSSTFFLFLSLFSLLCEIDDDVNLESLRSTTSYRKRKMKTLLFVKKK